jgi:uncharacterized protein (DUF305 family)
MRKVSYVIALLLLCTFTLTATAAMKADPVVATVSKLSGKAFDIAFLRESIPLHEEAVEIAMTATLNADHSELLKWNQRMVERKNKHVRTMLSLLAGMGSKPTSRKVGVTTPDVKKMRQSKGAALEKVYIPLIAGRLEQTAGLGKVASAKGSAEVRKLGSEIAKTEAEEAKMLRAWMKKWYGGSN